MGRLAAACRTPRNGEASLTASDKLRYAILHVSGEIGNADVAGIVGVGMVQSVEQRIGKNAVAELDKFACLLALCRCCQYRPTRRFV